MGGNRFGIGDRKYSSLSAEADGDDIVPLPRSILRCRKCRNCGSMFEYSKKYFVTDESFSSDIIVIVSPVSMSKDDDDDDDYAKTTTNKRMISPHQQCQKRAERGRSEQAR